MSSHVLGVRPQLLLAGALLVANLLGLVGWIWDWLGHLNGVTIQGAHLVMDVGALSIVLALVLAARQTPSASTLLISYALLIVVAVVVLAPIALMSLYNRSTLAADVMRWYMGSLRVTGGIPFAIPLLALALWAAWIWLRAGGLEGWRLAVGGGLAILAVGVLVDVYWHQTHPMVADTGQYMNTLTLPGHQLQLLGFVVGGVGAAIGASSPWARPG